MKILVPVDVWETQTNEHLPQDLLRMLPDAQAKLILVYALQNEPHLEKAAKSSQANADSFCDELAKKAKSNLDDLAAQMKKSFADVETVFEHGTPVHIIESVAKSKLVDLIALRGSSAGLMESVFLGNTISQIIKHSPISILVLRSGLVMAPLNKVLIALDGSEQAKLALREFCQLYKAKCKDIELVLSHVVSIPGPWRFISPVEFVAGLEDNLDMAARAILAEGESLVMESGWKPKTMPVQTIIRTGDPAVEIDRLASEIGAGLIVLGAQGKTAIESFLLGSVSEALALKSSYPILVFK